MLLMLPDRWAVGSVRAVVDRRPTDCGVMRERTARIPAARESALCELQALAAAAKKKQPDAHDGIHPNPGPRTAEAETRIVPPIETPVETAPVVDHSFR